MSGVTSSANRLASWTSLLVPPRPAITAHTTSWAPARVASSSAATTRLSLTYVDAISSMTASASSATGASPRAASVTSRP